MTNQTNQKNQLKSWHDVYKIFMAIVDEIWSQNENEESRNQCINTKIDEIYLPHMGESIWDKAYDRWYDMD